MPRAEPPQRSVHAPLPQAPLDDAQRLACLRLIRSENVGPATFRELINHYGGATLALEALPELARRGGRRRIRICAVAEAEAELAAAARVGARPLFTIEPGYPVPLAHVELPPPVLYIKGREALLARPCVAIVGSRNASAAGLAMTRQLAGGLGHGGYVVVSGLARGVDSTAHRAALETGTVAVVAGGIDVVYPPENEALQREIGECGCIVSEMPAGFVPRGRDFPRRNRLISGISLGVVVIEAARRSGSLITARMAGEQGRLVLAVPGHPLDPRAEGTNALIKEGATFVTGADDVIEAVAPLHRDRLAGSGMSEVAPRLVPADGQVIEAVDEGMPTPAAPPLSHSADVDSRALVLAALGPAPVAMDELARATGLPVRLVQSAVIELALAGRVERHGAALVSRIGSAD